MIAAYVFASIVLFPFACSGNVYFPNNTVTKPAVSKPFVLTMFGFISRTGVEPQVGETCETAVREAVNVANANADFLPDYHIELAAYDEGGYATFTPRSFLQFVRTFDEGQHRYLAPVTFGPIVACNYVDLVMKQYHLAMFSQNCNAPTFTENNKRYHSNLYSVRVDTTNQNIATVAFLREMMPWRRIGIASTIMNAAEYAWTLKLNSLLMKAGFEIAIFAADVDVTNDMVNSLKEHSRIIFFQAQLLPNCVKFFCKAAKAGIRAPNYVIFTNFACYMNSAWLQQWFVMGCNQKQLEDTLKILYYTGSYQTALQNFGRTTFGYDLVEYDRIINAALMKLPNKAWTFDYGQRHLCHDMAITALVTMDYADRVLKRDYNLTLRDFERYPEFIGNVVNQSVFNMEVYGTRSGRIVFLKTKLMFDNEPLYVTRQDVNGTMTVFYTMTSVRTAKSNETTYEVKKVTDPVWFTKSGKPPKDLSEILHRVIVYPTSDMTVICFLSGSALAIQVLLTYLVLRGKAKIFPKQGISANSVTWLDNVILLMGCIATNVLNCIFVIGSSHFPIETCRIWPMLVFSGSNFVSASLSFRVFGFINFLRLYNAERDGWNITRQYDFGNARLINGNSRFLSRMRKAILGSVVNRTKVLFKRFRLIGIFSTVLPTFVILVVWLVIADTPTLTTRVSPVLFDENEDTYYVETIHFCISSYQRYWITSVIAIQVTPLLLAAFVTIEYHKLRGPSMFQLELSLLRVSVVNAIGIYFGTILVSIVFLSADTTVLVTILASALIIYNVSLSCTVLYPVMRHKAIEGRRFYTSVLRNLVPTL